MDFTSLKAKIVTKMNRNDLAAQLDSYVEDAEGRLNDELKLYQWEQRAKANTTAGVAYLERPPGSDGIRTIKLNTSPVTVLKRLSPENMTDKYGNDSTGRPQAWCMVGNEIQLAPTPGDNYEVEISYYKRPTALSDTNTTNWYTINASRVLLYACLVEASAEKKDDTGVNRWEAKYQQAIKALVDNDNGVMWSSSPLEIVSDSQ